MRLIFNIPDAKCAKCGETAPILPQNLQRSEKVSGMIVRDNAGGQWRVNALRPRGWVSWPIDSEEITQGLCTSCAAEWRIAARAFVADGGAMSQLAPAAAPPAAPQQREILQNVKVGPIPVMVPQQPLVRLTSTPVLAPKLPPQTSNYSATKVRTVSTPVRLPTTPMAQPIPRKAERGLTAPVIDHSAMAVQAPAVATAVECTLAPVDEIDAAVD